MGYISDFTIELADARDTDAFREALEALNTGYGESMEEYAFGEFRTFGVKWYDFDHDMMAVAKAVPQVEFYTTQEGEDGDGWKYVYKDGEGTLTHRRGWETV